MQTEVDKLMYIHVHRNENILNANDAVVRLMISHHMITHLKNHKHVSNRSYFPFAYISLETCCHKRFDSILLTHMHIVQNVQEC